MHVLLPHEVVHVLHNHLNAESLWDRSGLHEHTESCEREAGCSLLPMGKWGRWCSVQLGSLGVLGSICPGVFAVCWCCCCCSLLLLLVVAGVAAYWWLMVDGWLWVVGCWLWLVVVVVVGCWCCWCCWCCCCCLVVVWLGGGLYVVNLGNLLFKKTNRAVTC